jgi:hypothetical protein
LRARIGETALAANAAWVSVEREERGPQRFWRSLLDALGDTEAGASVLSDMCAAPDLDPCGLVENLALIERPVWLVIDGLHELRSVDALRQLELFLLRAPDRLRVVLSSRHELRLGLHRLRLEGALTEIGADDLRFSEDEARELLASAGVVLSESALGALLERAEGWAAGLRLAALGEDVADPQCKERSTVLRLAGTINYKTGAYARIIEANLALSPYDPGRLVGDLPDPPSHPALSPVVRRRGGESEDLYKRIPAAVYFPLLAGIKVPPRGGLVRCPAHDDEHPSCSVSSQEPVWKCHACGAGGTIYDLASAVLGGPTGAELRGEAFQRARAYVVEVLGDAADVATGGR